MTGVGGTIAAAYLGPDAVLAAATGDGSPSLPGPAGIGSGDWATISALLEDATATYTEPWDDATCRTLMRGAYLGNGDLGAHLGGTIHSLKYYLGKNGFHAGNDVAAGRYNQHILNLAILTIEAALGAESGDTYRVTQDLRNAEVTTVCTMAGSAVHARACMAPSDNVLALELSTNGGNDVPLRATLSVIGNQYVARAAGHVGPVAWVTKEPNADGAPFYVKGAVAAAVLGAAAVPTTDQSAYSRLEFTLPASGATVRLFVRAEHTKDAASPLATVQAAAREATTADFGRIRSRNRAWWKRFWLRSYIKLGDDIQRYWYNHLYMVGSCARSVGQGLLGRAPGHWGPWNRADDMEWFSNLGMNYNAQNPYYGAFSANHVDLVDPYIETVRHYSETTGRKRVANGWVSREIKEHMPPDCRGVEFEGSFTSHGTSCGGGAYPEEDCCMPSNAVFGILPIVWKWKYGRERAFLANTCYPLMLAVADFYDDYIGKPVDGRYDVYGSVHEGANWFTKNDMFSLGAIRFLYREIIAASLELRRDAERRAHWQDILDHMSPYPLQPWGDTVTFRPDWVHDVMEALTFQGGARNTGLMFTTTFDNIGHETLPAYRIATCKTLDKGTMFNPQRFCGWQNGNDFGMMFVMAVRAGYRPDRVIEAIKGWKPEPNGVVSQKDGGGIETAGIIEAINNMLLQSHDGVIRVFPNWDRNVDAEFRRLRAVGAFLVDAKFRAAGQTVRSVRVFSEKGHRCVLQSPFEGACVAVTRTDSGQPVATVRDEETFAFQTTAGVTYDIARAECPPPPAGAPRITRQPESATVAYPASATFTVAASGKRLRYQWQKNREDIPGATAETYTTPPTTLWDTGSSYRCVVSNPFGTVRSDAAILNPGAYGPTADGMPHAPKKV
ncbi:MAG: hypothetical protein NT029_14460 [Armatimonadetes bacterium]|nr:hypothetical protein [Armatimonadota bacterium]